MPSESRRAVLQATAAAGITFISASGRAAAFSLADAPPLTPNLLPSADELGRQTVQMNNRGDRFTGNDAHRAHVEYLVKGFQDLGLTVQRDTATFSRWLATKWAAKLTPASGPATDLTATSYYPYSGQTGPEGVTGELVALPNTLGAGAQIAAPGDLKGKIVFIEIAGTPSPVANFPKPAWGGAKIPTHISAVWGSITPGFLGDLKKAGVSGVILGWTNISDAQAQGQYSPYGRPLQNLPCIWVGKDSTAKLRAAAGSGAKATVVLQADVAENTPVDMLHAVLPGTSSDSVLVVESHSDGMNFLEENGSLGLLALAKYFSKQPKASRKRDMVFAIPNHFARGDLIGAAGWIQKHPDIMKKTAAWVTVEHLGCREWFDNAAGQYAPSGQDEITYAFTDFKNLGADILQGGTDRLAAVQGRPVYGEGGPFSRTGIPGIGFFPAPNYLLSFAKNGHIEKFSKTLMHAQIEHLARAIHKLDGMTAEEIRAV